MPVSCFIEVGRGDSSTDTASEGEPEPTPEHSVKKARHKLKIPSGRATGKKYQELDANPFQFPSDIKIEADITGNLVKESVSMLSFTKILPAEKGTAEQKPGTEILPVQIPGTSTSENKTTESELSRSEIPPGDTISQVQNSGVTTPGSTVAGDKSEDKKPEGSLSDSANAGNKIPMGNMSEDRNAGGINDLVKEKDVVIDVVSVTSASGLQDCGTSKNTNDLTEKAGCSKNEQCVTINPIVVNPATIERQGTLFTEGTVLKLWTC